MVEIIEHEEIVSASGDKKKFYTWVNSIADSCGGFDSYEEAAENAMDFPIDQIGLALR
jgi:hypothetical protein